MNTYHCYQTTISHARRDRVSCVFGLEARVAININDIFAISSSKLIIRTNKTWMHNIYLIRVIDIVVCERITTRAREVSEYRQTGRARQNVKKNIRWYVE